MRREDPLPGRNGRLVSKAKDDSSVTILVPTLFEMSKAIMKMRCDLEKTDVDEKILEEFSRLESALMKMTIDIEYLRRKGH
ncbi:MAG: hypothetical protein KGI25_01195 [Thaumarchaeota archaeon]|nr:hypothetical protein [Nitrososphaerota archaeon]